MKRFPSYGGVYILYDKNGDIIYVGCTSSFQRRLSSHHIPFSKAILIPNASERYEAKLIKKLQPKYNIYLKKSRRESMAFTIKAELAKEAKARASKLYGKYGLSSYIRNLVTNDLAKQIYGKRKLSQFVGESIEKNLPNHT